MMLIREKVNQAKQLLKEFDIDCWITFTRESQINGDPTLDFLIQSAVTWHSVFAVTQAGRTHAIVGRYDKKSVEETRAYDQVVGYVESFREPFLEFLKEENPKNIAVNYSEESEICDGLTHGLYITLKKTLSEIGLQDHIISAEKIISALRERKSKTEIDHIREAIKHTQEIFEKVTGFIRIGKTEQEIAAFMSDKVKRRGLTVAWEESVCPAVFTGPETAEAHYAPTSKKVAPGHVLNMDFGVKVNHYCSDLQRTFYILEKDQSNAPPDVQKGFETIIESIESARLAIKPGVLGKEVDEIARNIILSAGYEEYPHALGHQVGRFSHDGTALLGPAWEKYTQKPFRPLEQGMVFTIEPRLPVPNRGIVTIEEMVLVTENGAEYLSTPQKELILIH
jgi:Xaa-Pro aminopeptidase